VRLPLPDGGTEPAPGLTSLAEVFEGVAAWGAFRVACDGHGSFSRLVPESVKFGYALRGTDLIPVARGRSSSAADATACWKRWKRTSSRETG